MDLGRAWSRFGRNRTAVAGLIYLLVVYAAAALAPSLAPLSPEVLDFQAKLAGPSREHLLGTDHLGRDILSRLLYGARVSLSVGLVAVLISVVLGVVVGLSSGFFGGWLDAALMRVTDGMLSIPVIFLLIAVLSVFERTLVTIVVFIGLTRWMAPARLVRSEILKHRDLDYIAAARAIGGGNQRILWRHLLPQALPSTVVIATFSVAQAILIESAVSYLGLGIQPPTPSWGNMLTGAQDYVWLTPRLAVLPGMLIFLTVLAYNSFGDGLRDALDPRSGAPTALSAGR